MTDWREARANVTFIHSRDIYIHNVTQRCITRRAELKCRQYIASMRQWCGERHYMEWWREKEREREATVERWWGKRDDRERALATYLWVVVQLSNNAKCGLVDEGVPTIVVVAERYFSQHLKTTSITAGIWRRLERGDKRGREEKRERGCFIIQNNRKEIVWPGECMKLLRRQLRKYWLPSKTSPAGPAVGNSVTTTHKLALWVAASHSWFSASLARARDHSQYFSLLIPLLSTQFKFSTLSLPLFLFP